LRRYFFNPLEGLDLGPLERIARAAEPPRVLSGFGIVAHAAHGGTLLCSAKSIRATLPRYIPAPGLAWWLTEANLTGTRALFDTGLFVVGEETDPTSHAAASAHLMIAGQAGAYQLAGSATSLRAGRAYPVRLVSDVITEHPGVDHCVALTVRDPTNMYRAVAFALVFVDPSEPTRVRARAAELARELEERVHQELGADLVPDQIRIFAHTPALQDAGPDRAYCQAQFLDGMLDKKATHGAFCALSALRRLFASVPGTP
jgi:acyl-CoA synthetase (AMP-forming)/AMP-acid ligase II